MARKAGVRTTTYGRFRGVDFSTDAALVDGGRSPWAVNMVADTGGMPEKRLGWRTLHQLAGAVNGLFCGVIGGAVHFLAHCGTGLYRWDGERPVELRTGLHNGASTAVNMGGRLWIFTGGEYLVYDGHTVREVGQVAYVPTTIIGAAPAGGGQRFESINLLQPLRRNEFIPDGSAKAYQLDSVGLDPAPVTATVRGIEKVEGHDFSVNRTTGTVTWVYAPEAPLVGQEGEVVITFSKTTAGYRERVSECTIATTYGVGTSDRIVISGNPDYPNLDWVSGLNDPSYIPDLSYSVVGMGATAIVGYRRLGEYLAIIKEDNGQDSTVFLRSATLSGGGDPIFPIKQSIAGVGAVSRRGFGSILDEQLFLSSTGVYAITSSTLTGERIVQNRSFFVDPRLTREPGLEQATVVAWNGMLLVAVNAHVYLLDGRQDKTYRAKSQGSFVYECYYWENVPASCWLTHREGDEETLYFGTADGRVCRFNSDLTLMTRYSDNGAAISACWATPADDDGDVTVVKTMVKRGNSVTIKPYTRSGARICFRTERDPVDWQGAYDTMDIFDWSDIDFTRFTFNANEAPREVMFQTKVKRYKRLQIIIKNDLVNEGLGIFGITKHFAVGGFARQ